MPARDLRAFLAALDANDDLTRVRQPVRLTDLQASWSNDQHAMLFDQVDDSPFRVVTHLFSTPERMALALNVSELDEIRGKLTNLFDFNLPRGSAAIMTRLADFLDVARSISITNGLVRHPPLQDVIKLDDADASLFPALNAALLVANNPNGGLRLIRAVQACANTPKQVTVRTNATLPAGEFAAALVLGADPALIWSAGVPLPDGFDRALLAAWIRGKPVPFANAVSQPVEIPADAEAVIEGIMSAERPDGSRVLQVTVITHRERPIIPVRVMNNHDDHWARRATERLFLPMLRTIMPRLLDVHHVAAHTVIARASDVHGQDGLRTIYGLWGLIPAVTDVVLVDSHVDVQHLDDVIAAKVRRHVRFEDSVPVMLNAEDSMHYLIGLT